MATKDVRENKNGVCPTVAANMGMVKVLTNQYEKRKNYRLA
jgi:hypothetical protein